MDEKRFGSGAFDLRATGIEEVREIHDLGLACRIFDSALSLGEHSGHQDVLRAGNGGDIEWNTVACQLLGVSVDIAILEHEFGPEGLHSFEVLVNRAHADCAAAGKRDLCLAASGKKGTER